MYVHIYKESFMLSWEHLTKRMSYAPLQQNCPCHKTSRLVPAAAGSSPSMSLLVFWPLAGTFDAGEVLPRCAQLLWCELYVIRDLQNG